MALTEDQIVVQNNTLLDMFESPGMQKRAADDTNDYIRNKVREAGFFRKAIPPAENVTTFDRQLYTDKPVVIYDKESDLDWPVSVGYGGLPSNFYIQPRRFAVTPTLIRSPKVMKDKWTLRTSKYDIKQVFADNQVKDLQIVEDRSGLDTIDTLLIGAGSTMPESGSIQWQQLSGGFSRNSVVTATKQILQNTPFSIPVEMCLVNQITWAEVYKWDRTEAGGDVSEKALTQGYWTAKMLDVDWVITLKRGLVPRNIQYMFGPPKFLGKSVLFTPPTMYVKTENVGFYMFETVEEIGCTIAHSGAIAKAEYLPS
jgi:hypothetical protein